MRRLVLAAVVAGLVGLSVSGTSIGAQSPRVTFEVTSVKANTSGSAPPSWAGQGSQFNIQNYLLRDIILGAYGLRPYQLGEGPDWMELGWTPGDGAAEVVTRDAPGLFTAIVEQLALKLEPAVGPVDVLVIDSIERPAED